MQAKSQPRREWIGNPPILDESAVFHMTPSTKIGRPVISNALRETLTPANNGRKGRSDQNYCKVRLIIRWGFYAFIFSLLFEYPERTIPVEIPTLTGSIFLALTLIQPQICYRRIPKELFFFMAFVCVLGLLSTSVKHFDAAMKLLYLEIQIFFLMWSGYNLLRYERITRIALFTLILSCAVISLMQTMDIATSRIYDEKAGTRITVLGQNPNNLANNISLGLIALVGIFFAQNKTPSRFRYLLLPAAAFMIMAIIDTGSRGAPLAIGAGFLALALRNGTIWARIKSLVIVSAAIGLLVAAILQSETMTSRYMKSINENNIEGREAIFPAAWQMFKEKPAIGWGPIDNMYEVGRRAPIIRAHHPDGDRDTHNLYLEVLTATGLLGAIPLFTFILLCLRAGWVARSGMQGVLPLALVLAIMTINMSGNWIASKLDWLIMIYAVASMCQMVRLNVNPTIKRPRLSQTNRIYAKSTY